MGGGVTWTGLAALLISSLLSGTLVGVILKYRLGGRRLSLDERAQIRQTARDDFKLILEVVTGQRDEARAEVREMRGRFENFELEIQGLRLSQDFDPFPNWMVDLEGRYLYVSREFERQFLRNREPPLTYRDLIGKTHANHFPTEFCGKLKALSDEARRRPDAKARATTVLEGSQVTVHKFPIRVGGIIVAFAGYITEIEPLAPPALESHR
jgi:hypothetical protein